MGGLAMNRSGEPDPEFFEKLSRATYRRAKRPVEGVLIPDEAAGALASEIFENLLDRYKLRPSDAEFSAEALDGAHDHARHNVATDRTAQSDPQICHDLEDERYEKNLDLDRLQKKEGGGFADHEWNGRDPILRPFGFHLLLRKGLGNQDAEDVYLETFAELARERAKDGKAPVEAIVVFEEVIPLFSKMIQFRAIDWRRKQGALKNQPNTQSSFEDHTEREDGAMQFEDESFSLPTTIRAGINGTSFSLFTSPRAPPWVNSVKTRKSLNNWALILITRFPRNAEFSMKRWKKLSESCKNAC